MGVVDTFVPFIGQPDNQIGRERLIHAFHILLNTNFMLNEEWEPFEQLCLGNSRKPNTH